MNGACLYEMDVRSRLDELEAFVASEMASLVRGEFRARVELGALRDMDRLDFLRRMESHIAAIRLEVLP